MFLGDSFHDNDIKRFHNQALHAGTCRAIPFWEYWTSYILKIMIFIQFWKEIATMCFYALLLVLLPARHVCLLWIVLRGISQWPLLYFYYWFDVVNDACHEEWVSDWTESNFKKDFQIVDKLLEMAPIQSLKISQVCCLIRNLESHSLVASYEIWKHRMVLIQYLIPPLVVDQFPLLLQNGVMD